jgi:hypothetical protein
MLFLATEYFLREPTPTDSYHSTQADSTTHQVPVKFTVSILKHTRKSSAIYEKLVKHGKFLTLMLQYIPSCKNFIYRDMADLLKSLYRRYL